MLKLELKRISHSLLKSKTGQQLPTSLFHLSTQNQNKDYYRVLNVSRTANTKQIKQAYYKLSKKYHPDVNHGPSAENKFKELQEAYNILGDEQKRLEYDRGMSHGPGSPFHGGNMRNQRSPYGGHSGFGRTPAYDYDEWVRQHYPKNPYHQRNAYDDSHKRSANGPQTKQQESSHWNDFETEEVREVMRNRRRRFYTVFVFVLIVQIILYQVQLMERKREEAYRSRKYKDPRSGND